MNVTMLSPAISVVSPLHLKFKVRGSTIEKFQVRSSPDCREKRRIRTRREVSPDFP